MDDLDMQEMDMDWEQAYYEVRNTNDRLRLYLEVIKKGMGRYSRDPYTHASNTIEDMKSLAEDALNDIPFGERRAF